MKKHYLFLFVCFPTLSCTNEDETSHYSDSINPPGWIQGIWKTEDAEREGQYGVQFTADDLILLIHPELSLKEEFYFSKMSGSSVRVTETISPTCMILSSPMARGYLKI